MWDEMIDVTLMMMFAEVHARSFIGTERQRKNAAIAQKLQYEQFYGPRDDCKPQETRNAE